MATNSAGDGEASRPRRCGRSRSRRPSTLPSPSTLGRPRCSRAKRILALARARSCMIFDARSSSRRWTMVTVSANLVRKIASSRAESPPPTTAMSWSRKKKPSQVAQVETPWPSSSALAGQAEHQRPGAGGDDDRPRPGRWARRRRGRRPRPRRAGSTGRPGWPSRSRSRRRSAPPAARMPHHQLGAHDPVGEAGVVLDVGGQHQLAAGLVAGRGRLALEHQRRQVGPGGVDGGGEPGRAGADDDHSVDVVGGHRTSRSFGSVGVNPRPCRPIPGTSTPLSGAGFLIRCDQATTPARIRRHRR